MANAEATGTSRLHRGSASSSEPAAQAALTLLTSVLASCLLCASIAGCGEGTLAVPEGSDETSGPTSSAGGSNGTAGAGTAGDAPIETALPPACDPSTSSLGGIDTPSPVISVGAQVFASGNVMDPERAFDGLYTSGGFTRFDFPTEDAPAWLAIPIDGEPSRLLLWWSDLNPVAYNVTTRSPLAYRIETSANSTNGEDGTWQPVVEIEDNPVRSRAHSFDFSGQSWVRFWVTGAASAVLIDEIAIYDISTSDGEQPNDTWFFMGDSITMGAFQRTFGEQDFDRRIRSAHPAYTPIVINGGIGGELASHGVDHIAEWLALNPDFEHIAIAYGTNDAWGNQSAAVALAFEANLAAIVQAVLDAGRTPILPRIPYASVAHETLSEFNAAIDRTQQAFGLPCGPDLFSWFQQNLTALSSDGVHPTQSGYMELNRLWAEAVGTLYPDPE